MSKSRQNVTSRTQTRNYPQPGRGPPADGGDRASVSSDDHLKLALSLDHGIARYRAVTPPRF